MAFSALSQPGFLMSVLCQLIYLSTLLVLKDDMLDAWYVRGWDARVVLWWASMVVVTCTLLYHFWVVLL